MSSQILLDRLYQWNSHNLVSLVQLEPQHACMHASTAVTPSIQHLKPKMMTCHVGSPKPKSCLRLQQYMKPLTFSVRKYKIG